MQALSTWPSHLPHPTTLPSDRLFALTWPGSCSVTGGLRALRSRHVSRPTPTARSVLKGLCRSCCEWMGDFPDADNYLIPLLGCEEKRRPALPKGASAAQRQFWTRPGMAADLTPQRKPAGGRAGGIAPLRRFSVKLTQGLPYIPGLAVSPGPGQTRL